MLVDIVQDKVSLKINRHFINMIENKEILIENKAANNDIDHKLAPLERLHVLCKAYLNNDLFVYKLCCDISNKGDTNREWLVILKKINGTRTNETRSNVADKNCAKFRANMLKVVEIINIYDFSTTKSINNKFINFETMYTVDGIAEPNVYDESIHEVCSGGIHYFRTLTPAYYYRGIPDTHVGPWCVWHNNGNIHYSFNSVNGQIEGLHTTYRENGTKSAEVNYSAMFGKHGLYTTYYENGKKEFEGNYKNNGRTGYWSEWAEDGRKISDGNYVRNSKSGVWTWYYGPNNQIRFTREFINGTFVHKKD